MKEMYWKWHVIAWVIEINTQCPDCKADILTRLLAGCMNREANIVTLNLKFNFFEGVNISVLGQGDS